LSDRARAPVLLGGELLLFHLRRCDRLRRTVSFVSASPQNDGCYRTLPSFFPLPLSSFLTHFGLHSYLFFFRHLSIIIYCSWHQAVYLLEISSGYAYSSPHRREIFLPAFLASNSPADYSHTAVGVLRPISINTLVKAIARAVIV
jgi:hypothetical protein